MTDMTASIARPARHGSAAGLLGNLLHWASVARSRRALASLDAAQLDDLGISASEAQQEASRPFWDAPNRSRR